MSINPFDKAARFAAKLDPVEFLTWALGVPADRLGFAGWLDTRALPLPHEQDQIGDTIARLDPPGGSEPPWALAVEFQIEPDPLMFGRLLAYLAQIWQSLKPDEERGSRFQVGGAVLNLTGTGRAAREMRLPGTPIVTQLGVVERNLARESADDTVGRIERGELGRAVLPWLPLMDGGGTATMVERWKALAGSEPTYRRRAELASITLVFAEAAGCREAWKLGLKEWNVRESAVVNEWRAEGKAEGKAEARMDSIIEALEVKFVAVPGDLVAAVRGCTDLARLREWLGAALRAESLAAFRAAAGV